MKNSSSTDSKSSASDCCNTVKQHDHVHNDCCGHKAIKHDDHVDYVHDGHLHHVHGNHVDECKGPKIAAGNK